MVLMIGFAAELIIYLLSNNIRVPQNNRETWAESVILNAYSQAEVVGEQMPGPRWDFENWCRAIIRYNNLIVSREENRLEVEESMIREL